MITSDSREGFLGWMAAACLVLAASASMSAELQEPILNVTLEPQPLSQALLQVSRQANVTMVMSPELVQAKMAPQVHGTLPLGEALRKVLRGSGLGFVKSQEGQYAIVKLPGVQPTAGLNPRALRFAAASTPGSSGTRLAQSQPAATPVTATASGAAIEEVVVKALRRLGSVGKIDVSVLETPQSVSVIDSNRIGTMMSQTIMETVRYTPGVRPGIAFDTRRDDFIIRGFSETGQSGVFRDGQRLLNTGQYAAWEIDPYALERVEVLRGPSSVLYGVVAPGGVINMVTKRPTSQRLAEIGLTYGSFDRKQATVDFSGSLDQSGRWLYRLTALGRDAGTQVDRTADDRVFVAPAITFQPSDGVSLTVLGNYQKGKTGSAVNFLPSEGTVLPNPDGFGRIPIDVFTGEPDWDQFDKVQKSIGYLFEYDFGDDWRFLQNARYAELTLDYKTIYGDGWTGIATGTPPNVYNSLNRGALASDEKMNAFTVDSQLQKVWNTGSFEHTAMLGVDYQRGHSNYKRAFAFNFFGFLFNTPPPPINPYDPVYGQPFTPPPFQFFTDRTSKQTGAYVQDHIKYNDRLVLRLAARHDKIETDTVDPSTGAQTEKRDDTPWTYNAGLAYLLPGGFTPYVSYSTSFVPINGTDFSGNPFEPEKGRQLEGGFKYDISSLRSLLTVAVFDLRRQNIATNDPAHFGFRTQTGEIRSKGVEVEGTGSPMDGLNVTLAYTYNNVEVTKSNDNNIGARPDYFPEHMASLWADYTLPTKLTFGAGVRYIGSVPITSIVRHPFAFDVPSYTLYDAVISYEMGNYRVSLNGSNIFNKIYTSACDGYSCYPGLSRNVMATVRYRW